MNQVLPAYVIRRKNFSDRPDKPLYRSPYYKETFEIWAHLKDGDDFEVASIPDQYLMIGTTITDVTTGKVVK